MGTRLVWDAAKDVLPVWRPVAIAKYCHRRFPRGESSGGILEKLPSGKLFCFKEKRKCDWQKKFYRSEKFLDGRKIRIADNVKF